MKSCVWILLFLSLNSYGQQLKKLREIKLPPTVDRISVDRLGGFYTVNDCGIHKFSPEGKEESAYRPRGCHPTQLVEAWGYARVFAFRKDEMRFVVFDPKMEILDYTLIDPSLAIEPQLATPAPDLNSFWILDIDNSVKKFDAAIRTITLESDTLKFVKGKFTHMREYQGMLFLLERETGIYVLNKLGQLISKIDVTGINYFSFAGEDLYYLKDNQVYFHDLFSKDSYSIIVSPGYEFVVATDERLVLIKDGKAEVFAFTPRQ
jgi:hypothetical protein